MTGGENRSGMNPGVVGSNPAADTIAFISFLTILYLSSNSIVCIPKSFEIAYKGFEKTYISKCSLIYMRHSISFISLSALSLLKRSIVFFISYETYPIFYLLKQNLFS